MRSRLLAEDGQLQRAGMTMTLYHLPLEPYDQPQGPDSGQGLGAP